MTAIFAISVFAILAFAGTASAAEVITVNTTGFTNSTGFHPCSPPIQCAINNATAGDTINVAAGAYTENVNVDESLTLQGASSATVTVNTSNPAISVFTVTANSVNISGFTVTGATVGTTAGIFINAGVSLCNIHDNIATGNGDGIWLGAGSNHNTITSNNVSDNLWQGFEVYRSDDNIFTNNTANSNPSYGFKIDSGSNNEFTNNIANSNGKWGFYVVIGDGGGCNDSTFTNNTANLNVQYGIRINGGSGTTLTGNTFDSNLVSGIRLKETMTTLTLENNSVTNSPIGIEITDSVADVSTWIVSHNNIEGNTDYGVFNDAVTGTLDAEHNWWGDASGPSHSPGLGDKVSDNVDYEPWLMAPWPSTVTEETVTETVDGDGTMTDTPTGGDVTINATGNHTITTAKYAENPGGTPTFQATGDYWDVHLDNATNVTNVTIKFCPAGPGDTIYYYDTTAGWKPCSDQVYVDGCITVTITDATEPSLDDLTGEEFGRGTPEQVPVLTPLGIIALIGILGVVLAVETLKRKSK